MDERKNKDKDLDFYVKETIKDMYVGILEVVEDIFVDEIKANDDKWQRARSRILDIGNGKGRVIDKLLSCCTITPKKTSVKYICSRDKVIEVVDKK